MACPASANLDVAIPGWQEPDVDPTAGAKGRGTRLHEKLEQVVGMSMADLRDYAAIVAYVAELRGRRRFKVLTEETVTAEWLTSRPTTTADLVLYTRDELHIVDYKFGRIPVDVIDNEQMLFYAASYSQLAPKARQVSLHILQPAAGNLVEWQVETPDIAAFMMRAKASEKLILAKDTTFGPSDHCTFCPANPHSRGDKGKPLCPAMLELLYPEQLDEDALLDE
jgi:hypothetical protein